MTNYDKIRSVKQNILHFGLDELDIYGTFKYENELFEKLNFDNSNYGELEDYTFTKNEVPKYKYKIMFSKNNYSLFAYYKGDKDSNSVIKTKDKIIVYSTAFKILNYEEIKYFLSGYFTLRKCVRFDVCLDITIDINHVLRNFKKLKTGNYYIKDGKVETQYIGEINKYKNKRQVIRIYNKILDIHVKHKHKLYKNYLLEDYVTRAEIEFRPKLAKNITFDQVFDNEYLTSLFTNYTKKHTDIFKDLSDENITLYRKPKEKIDPELYQGTFYKTQRKKIFIGHAKTIFNMGYCPIRVLIAEGLILDKTKRMLGLDIIGRISELERRLIQDALIKKAKRKDFQHLLDNSPENDGVK